MRFGKQVLLAGLSIIVLMGTSWKASDNAAGEAGKVFDRFVENCRWSHYWSGSSGIDDAYVAGRRISGLVFWTNKGGWLRSGLCSSELSLCVGYSGPYLNPRVERMVISRGMGERNAFEQFVDGKFGAPVAFAPAQLRPSDLDFCDARIYAAFPRCSTSINNKANRSEGSFR